jgi:hypothetical protein
MRQRLEALWASGATDLVVATGVAGGAGYLLTLLAGIELGPSKYVLFGVLWSSLFFTVGTLNGLQQEIARATRPSTTEAGRQGHVVRDVVAGVATVVAIAVLATGPAWVPAVFGTSDWWLAFPIAIGLAGHAITTSLVGMLHGLRQSRLIAGAVILDGLLRLGLVLAVLSSSHALAPISWALVLPYFVMPFLIWIAAGRRLRRSTVDSDRPGLIRHIASTLVAAAASGAMVSGISLLVAAAGRSEPAAHVGATIFAINITRAPLIIVVVALQNLIVVRLRDHRDWRRILAVILGAVAMATVALSGAAGVVGPTAIAFLLHGEGLYPFELVVIVGSGGLVAMMSVTGAAVLARGRHSLYTLGWILAAGTTVITLLAIPGFDRALTISLLAGPAVGLVIHALAIAFDRYSSSRDVSPAASLAEF